MCNPFTPPLLLFTKTLSLVDLVMTSAKKKPVKAITDSLSPPTSCHNEAQSEKMAFPPFVHPMGYPMSFFHCFLIGCVGWNVVLLILSEKLGNFYFSFIFFHYFSPFFRKNIFWPINPHLMPPMDHPTSAVA